ncbi:Indole-3-acetic acid-amido synthetase GH3.3, partial [Thalictrum thalictroides]
MDGKKLEYKGEEALKEVEYLTSNAPQCQENVLKEILKRNGSTEYLNKYLEGSTSYDILAFKNLVPVITYADIRPFIQRIANGEDSSLLSGHTITEMLCSSGTSAGEPKLMPSIAQDLDRRTFLYNLIMPIIN